MQMFLCMSGIKKNSSYARRAIAIPDAEPIQQLSARRYWVALLSRTATRDFSGVFIAIHIHSESELRPTRRGVCVMSE